MTSPVTAQPHAILAFNKMAKEYDDHFTRSLIGRAQRDAVWDVAAKTFHSGDRILELNCGTGEDAFFFARNGISVVACDASDQMIQVARQRHQLEAPSSAIEFRLLPTEDLLSLQPASFDGAFSNFSGLNCVANLRQTAQDLATLLKPGSSLLVCMSTRICISEIAWYLFHGNSTKAFRRYSGHTTAKVDEFTVDVYYPTLRELQKLFSPYFAMRSCKGIGIAVPPSYVESTIRKYPRILSFMRSVDGIISTLPWFRVIGDHMLIRFERAQS